MVRRKARGSRSGVRRGELTPEETAKTGATAGEGFTVRVSGRGAGRPARNVFSTGFSPETGRSAEVPIDPNLSAADQISAFNKQRIADLSTPGTNMAIGGWQDPETGKVAQDASVLTPRTREGLEAAMQIGSYSRQQAIGNLGLRRYEGDVPIPEHLHKGQFAWHESEGTEPHVQELPPPEEGGRKTIRIVPSRKEMASVEATLMAEKLNLKD